LIYGYHNPFSNTDREFSPFMNVATDKSRFQQSTTHVTPNLQTQTDKNQQQIASNSNSISNTYVPQVEAISPTPEDQKETLNLLDLKQKICAEINKIDKDIASTQYQVEQLKKKQVDIENASQNKDNLIDENDKNSSLAPTLTLAEKIYQDNRKKAADSHAKINKSNENSQEQSNIPLYHEYCDTLESKKIRIL
jgi:hypothetical protein